MPISTRRRFRIAILCGVATIAIGYSASALAQSSCLLEVENVKLIAANVPMLLDYAEQDFSKETGKDTAAADEILRPIVTKVFGEDILSRKLSENLEVDDCESPELLAIGKRLQAGNAKPFEQLSQKSTPETVVSEEKVKELEALADSFALPELIAENSVAGAAMHTALAIYFTEKPGEFAKLDENEAKAMAKDVLPELRQRHGNPIMFDRDVSRGTAKAQLTRVLSTLPEEDIKRLKEFYSSPSIMAEKDKLIVSYRELIDRDSITMLGSAIEAFRPHFNHEAMASNPRKN